VCGRYTLALPLSTVVEAFRVDCTALDELEPRYNIAPTQDAPAILQDDEGERRLGLLRWGLVPGWADDPSLGSRLINARSETVSSKPAFRNAFRRRRCLIPADGFYEWRKPGQGGEGKTPFHIRRRQGGPLGMAGLWERWRDSSDRESPSLYTFTILTRDAAGWMKGIHGRAPVILGPDQWDGWLATTAGEAELLDVLTGAASPPLEAVQVSTRVNAPRNDGPGCVEPVSDGERFPQES